MSFVSANSLSLVLLRVEKGDRADLVSYATRNARSCRINDGA
jgi:hypothetical protein